MVFKFREYRFFWLAAAFSNVGMWALIYGRLWLMHTKTDSPVMVGLSTTASLAPILLFSLWGGVLADRVNRLRLVRATRAMFAALAILTGVLVATDVIGPWHIIAISVGTGVLLSFDIPSRAAMLPTLVPREHLASAVALYSLVFGGAAILGPAAFSPLVNLWGIEGVFFIVGGAYILTVVALMFMSPAGHRPEHHPSSMLGGLVEGLSYVRRNHAIGGVIFIGMVMGIFGSSFQSLLPVFADEVVTGGIDTFSRLLLSEGIGGLIATLAIAILGIRVRPARFYVLSGVGFGLGLLVLSQADRLVAAALTVGFLGACFVVFQTMSTTLMQTLASDEFRGRVMSVHQLTWGASALGGLLMGVLAVNLGIQEALGLGGTVVAFSTVLVAFWLLRRLLGFGSRVASHEAAGPRGGGRDG